MQLLFSYLTRFIEGISEWSGRTAMWLGLLLVLVTAYETGQRYLLHQSSTALQELTWHLYSALFLVGLAYTFKQDGHVRVDIFYDRLSARGKAIVNIFSVLFLLIPFSFCMIYFSLDWVRQSMEFGERSPDPGGLASRWLLKTILPLGFGLLLLQGLAELIRNIQIFWKRVA
jgi:TRAP-type mannitol/chloroaromatic compound transport system permease small subunit